MKKTTLYILAALASIPAFAGHKHPESYYQDCWCAAQGGTAEVVLADNTRCDCITASHAIEVDFSEKWAEAIGQALFYSMQTGHRAGVALIIETPADRRHWIRLNSTINHFSLPLDTWEVN